MRRYACQELLRQRIILDGGTVDWAALTDTIARACKVMMSEAIGKGKRYVWQGKAVLEGGGGLVWVCGWVGVS